MKKPALLLLGALGLLASPAAAVQRHACDQQKSVLCRGLANVFQMEEDSDRNRDSVAGGLELFEAPTTNVARATGKIGSYAVSFSGVDGTYLYIPRGGALGNNFTVAMWVYPTSASTEQILLSSDEATAHGPYLSLVPSAGNVKVKAVSYYGDAGGDVSVTSTASMTLNAWHLVVWGVTPYFLGQQSMFVQVDNGARDSVALTYWLTGNGNDLILGQRKGVGAGVGYTLPYSGRIDQLTLSSQYWETSTASLFYNAGSGKAYPFDVSSYDSLNAGLVAYWKFDEAVSSGTRYDSVNQNNATDTGSVGYAAGKIGNAAYSDYNPAAEALRVTSNSNIEYSGDFTVGGWFNQGHVGQVYIAAKSDYSASEWFLIDNGAGATSQFGVNNATTACLATTGNDPFSGNTWVFVVATYTASTKTCTIQFNNGTVYSATGTGVATATTKSLDLIALYGSGYRDEWFLYKRVLTSTDITNLYNGGTGRTYPF